LSWVYFNGSIVPSAEAFVTIFDRGFLYGDGLFESIPFFKCRFFAFEDHWRRFEKGLEFLRIRSPITLEQARSAADILVEKNLMSDGIFRLQVTRGKGNRGYSPRGAEDPTCVAAVFPLDAPDKNFQSWTLQTSSFRLATGDPVHRHKTCNKLIQVMAKSEAEGMGADEALLLTDAGLVAETSSGNIFWLKEGTLFTPPETFPLLPGITRDRVTELASKYDLKFAAVSSRPEDLFQADGVFITFSSFGIVEVFSLDGKPLPQSARTKLLWDAYWKSVFASIKV